MFKNRWRYIPRFMQRIWLILYYSVHQFIINGGLYRASALTFTTLLSLVPLMSVSFTVISSFPASKEFSQKIQNLVFENFVAAKSDVLETYFQEFSQQVHQLSPIGLLFLVMSAVLMLFTIEQTLNDIWKVKDRRHGGSAFLMYWGFLTLIPFLVGIVFAVGSYLLSIPLVDEIFQDINLKKQLHKVPVIISFIFFLVLYVIVPNIKVQFRHGFAGALVATALFELAKFSFAAYLKQFNSYELLYGAFAIIPIFLVWLYIVWSIVIFGAEVTHTLSRGKIAGKEEQLDPFTHAFIWLRRLWLAQRVGRYLTLNTLVNEDQFSYQLTPVEQMNYLIKAQIIRRGIKGSLLLSRDLYEITLENLYWRLPWKIPKASALPDDVELKALKDSLKNLELTIHDDLNIKLSTLFDPAMGYMSTREMTSTHLTDKKS